MAISSMTRPKRLASLLLAGGLWLLGPTRVVAQSKPAFRLPSPDSLRSWMARSHVPVVGVGLIKRGRVRRVRVVGELRPGVPAPPNTLFPVASLTKPLVTLTVLQLVQRGQWSLDEPLMRYWTDPDVATDPQLPRLTTRLVLSHQTGFPNWRYQLPGHRLAFLHAPGTTYGYSGEGFEYLRQALERKFGCPLQQLSDAVLGRPLRLRDTRYSWAGDTQVDSTRLAVGHDARGAVVRTPKPAAPNAADGLVTTMRDYTRFGAWVVRHAGLSDTLFRAMVAPVVSTGSPNQFMSLGWEVRPVRSQPGQEYLLVHSGRDEGLLTLIVLLPRSRRGLVILTNADTGGQVAIQVLRATLNLPELAP